MGTWSFPGVEVAGAWGWPPPPSSAEVLERIELYLYSPSGPSWPIKRVKPTYLMHMRSNIHTDFVDMISCSLVEIIQLFRGEWILPLFSEYTLYVLQIKAVASSEILVNLYQALWYKILHVIFHSLSLPSQHKTGKFGEISVIPKHWQILRCLMIYNLEKMHM